MTISDGYGDQMTADQVEDLIRQKERLLQIQAAERQVDPNDWDDALNEARITVWKIAVKGGYEKDSYIHASTGKRITEVQARGNWTGQPSQRGKPSVDPIRRKDRDSLDDPDWQVQIAAQGDLEDLLLAYHEGEILRALSALPERHRRYVVLRFWGGWTNTECAPVLGVKPGNVARMWTDSIRPVLAEHLAHLVGV